MYRSDKWTRRDNRRFQKYSTARLSSLLLSLKTHCARCVVVLAIANCTAGVGLQTTTKCPGSTFPMHSLPLRHIHIHKPQHQKLFSEYQTLKKLLPRQNTAPIQYNLRYRHQPHSIFVSSATKPQPNEWTSSNKTKACRAGPHSLPPLLFPIAHSPTAACPDQSSHQDCLPPSHFDNAVKSIRLHVWIRLGITNYIAHVRKHMSWQTNAIIAGILVSVFKGCKD